MSAGLVPLDKALAFLLGEAAENPAVVDVPLAAALGCVLASPHCAAIDVPSFDNSAMDGYAVNTADLDAPGCELPVTQAVAAGHPGRALARGSAARIFTGAPIPEGADAVVIQENTRAEKDWVAVMVIPHPGDNIRLRGHDIARDTVVLDAGRRLRAQDIGLLASLGIERVSVRKPLKVAIVNTGDEVVAPGQALAPGQIYDSNSFTLAALLAGLGMDVIRKGIVADTLAGTAAALEEAAAEADCIITTGGVSVGEEDHVRAAVEQLGQLALWKLAIKPGKPFSFGRVAGKPFFGLPGNPVAVFVTFVMLVRPWLLKVQGAAEPAPPVFRVRAGFSTATPVSRLEFLRVRLSENNAGEQVLVPFPDQGSSIMTSLSWADGLAEIPLGETVSEGQKLKFIPFSGIL